MCVAAGEEIDMLGVCVCVYIKRMATSVILQIFPQMTCFIFRSMVQMLGLRPAPRPSPGKMYIYRMRIECSDI